MVNGENSEVKPPPLPSSSLPPSYLEVKCTSTKKVRRFSVGTEAAFALKVINAKIGDEGLPMGLYIEAVKDGEESVSFGPNSVLVSYGDGWKLQTVMHACRVLMYSNHAGGGARARPSIRTPKHESSPLGMDELQSTKGLLPSNIGPDYIWKVLLAFVFLFVFGAVFTLALENLPKFLIYINSSIYCLNELNPYISFDFPWRARAYLAALLSPSLDIHYGNRSKLRKA
nr:serine hydroxymethyltransferase [Tanacetum cinerariifolium]